MFFQIAAPAQKFIPAKGSALGRFSLLSRHRESAAAMPNARGPADPGPWRAVQVPLVTLRADMSRLARPQTQTPSSDMTPEEREDLEDIEASVTQIATLVRTADADASLSAENAARIADIAAQTLGLVADLLAEAEDDDLAEERVDTLRDLLEIATTSDATARRILAGRSLN
ncbi:hypothetical protein [Falsirhodobacter xinxiangensis]|uniref:hypothetical protein n=1 Tax=Falsirhodobacter xinxiangensis TaxID=2530049 RepID=UPI001C706E67|nr:hypothetical protein [Rhodobacter xinxiangensis]